MRRNRELNSWEKKDLARRKYAERQLQKFIDWSVEVKGYLKYKDLIKYSVYHEDSNHNLIFHKSKKTERWWLEVPYPPTKDFKFERHHLIPCNHEDYKIAQNGVIPDLWWKTYRKLN